VTNSAAFLAADAGQCDQPLAFGLTRISTYAFPIMFNDTTRAFFAEIARPGGGMARRCWRDERPEGQGGV
jgi:hypothetical protein